MQRDIRHLAAATCMLVMPMVCSSSHAAEPAPASVSSARQAGPAYLGTSEVVQAALTDTLAMRTAVSTLVLQAQRLSTVARTEFTPKLGTSASIQRAVSIADGFRQSTAQTQAALDLNWRLRSGANVKLSNSLTRSTLSGLSGLPGQQASGGRSVGVSITQPLLKGAGRTVTEAGLMGEESGFRLATKALNQTANALVAQALGAYITVQQAQAATQQAQAAYELAQRVNDRNIALVNAGRSPRNVLLQSEFDVSSARLGIAQAENVQRQAVRALAQAMGRSNLLDGLELVLTDTFEQEDDGPLPDEQALVARALQSSSELFAAREAVLLSELALTVASNGLLPSLALSVGSTMTPSGTIAGSNGKNHFVDLILEYSFDRAGLKLEKSTAQTNVETALAQLVNVDQQVRDNAIDALRNLMFARAQRALARTALTLAAQQLDAEVTRQSLGRISPLELSNAQQSLAASNRQLLDATGQVFRSRVELAQIDGSLLQKWGGESLVDGWVMRAKQELDK